MYKKFLAILLFISFSIKAQNELKGTMIPADETISWIVLYQLKGAKQIYLGNSKLENGTFHFHLPKNSEHGMYRLTYKLEGNGSVDFIYLGESIDLQFDPNNATNTITFLNSEDNNEYFSYLRKSEILQQKLDSIQVNYFKLEDLGQRTFSENLYKGALKYNINVQKSYDSVTLGKLSNSYIKAHEKYYNQTLISNPQEFLNSEKTHFFDFIDFNDKAILNSSILGQKIVGYVFYLNRSDDDQVQTALYKKAVKTILDSIENNVVSSEIQVLLLNSFSQLEHAVLIDYLLENYYYKLPEELQQKKFVNEVLKSVKLAIGKVAPDFSWKENSIERKLSEFNKEGKTVLVFWSTDCSHCLKEIPQLYEYFKSNEKAKIIAYALEENEDEFNQNTKKFKNWTNILGLDKWTNKVAKDYEVIATPTYFVLDKNKKIIAKPEFFRDVKAFFEN